MISKFFLLTCMVFLPLTGSGHAAYHAAAETQTCVSHSGQVINVVNDEVFTISVCSSEKVFREFSYCYGVQKGDKVMFHSNPEQCEMTGFTVLRNDVQCGVLCP